MPHLARRPRRHQHLLELCLRPLRIREEHRVHRHLRIIILMKTLSRTHPPRRLNKYQTRPYIRPLHPILLLPLLLYAVVIIVNAAALVTSTLFPLLCFLHHL
jgi:hypothetical protein